MAAETTVDERDELDDRRDQRPEETPDENPRGEDADETPEEVTGEDEPTRPAARERRSWISAVLRWPTTPVRAFARLLMRKPVLTLCVLGVIALLLAGGVGVVAYLRQQQTTAMDARGAATDAARSEITTILSYNYQTFDRDLMNATELLTGDFQQQYRDLMTGTVRTAALDQQTVTNASVARSSVISATPASVETLIFVNQTTTSKASQGPQLSGSRVQVTMTKVGDRWLISHLTPL
ncbi:hypothetical protein LWP59_05820 [Amycolatopsis acidiphila]|uniref:Mce-associated membrane protein n=1 Tax=Amycolatopsis acidiphila TaxID=715473 RepID=A0A558AHW0_9PSEU|nr:hypothetical protein [Amycolatopsis acidiphila]TVT23863.1 hypothetical protein FNH06_08330 [Amycolatopsis acidiphila]UIJ61162.1 hypothetical protein LWP59_05820 [Amycolatopsis acidiphila]GHG86360.1 hypothetical protein GCM10017788_59400 [Amycolatopsis acidiphila]